MMSILPNPYEPPSAVSCSDSVRPELTRASLAELIRAFLASEITAHTLDQELDAYIDLEDPVIRHVVEAVWYHYDDCDDHLVCFTKQQWDYFQRLLLALAADGRVETQVSRRWSFRQFVAAVSLVTYLYLAFQTGWGGHLLMLSIPFGILSIGLSFWRSHTGTDSSPDPYAPIVFPFATFSDLATAYHATGFRKMRYPKHISARRVRSPLMQTIGELRMYAAWLLLSPFPLLFQSFPEVQAETRIITT